MLPLAEELVRIDQAFRAGQVMPGAPPSRFYVNLTEACNLRCLHCITDAPARTAEGRGRVMSREVLDALAPHLAAALYVGLTHAGEPTTAPMLVSLLEALRTRRAGRASVVHLLTNGLTVTEARFAELTELGVSSWSFSVDGLSEGTHDALRVGSKITKLTARLEALAALRAARFPGVRMGIAWTATRANLGELLRLVDFAKAAGLDWVKVEEVYPINAAGQALVPDGQALSVAVRAATDRADALGLPLLDHTESPAVWKCRLDADPRMARFSRLDDLVNRQEINGCRFPWEVVCVEPNGDVKPMSFHHPVAGNLLERDLLALWSAPAFIVERTRSMLQRPCGRGPITCPTDRGPAAW